MHEAGRSRSNRSYLRFVLLLTGVVAGLLVVGWMPTRNLGGPEAISGMILGCSLSLLAAIVGGLPQLGPGRRKPRDQGLAALMSLAIRMGLTLMGALAAVLGGLVAPKAFLLWVGLSYLSLLLVDVLFVLTTDHQQ
jgi:hypothetical protein